MSSTLPVVLVHGAWHGAWSWAAVQHALDRRGVPSYAIDLPGRGTSTETPRGMVGDALAVDGVLDLLDREVVLVGHSYAGAVIGEVAGRSERVVDVVYVAALAVRRGESIQSFLRSAPRHAVKLSDHMRPQEDGSILLDPTRADEIYTDLDPLAAQAHVARLSPQPADTFTQELSGDPFGRVPTTYVLCERDEAVAPEHQELFAARCDRVVRLDSDHFPMFHAPDAIADVLTPLARRGSA